MPVLRSLVEDTKGAAAAEMALVTPLLVILLFGGFELGYYFYSQQVVTKAVRDGSRYAARLGFADYSGCAASSGAESNIKTVTRTGTLSSASSPLLRGWTNAATITVSVSCHAATTTGIYRNMAAGAPRVTVAASVPYTSLFGSLVFDDDLTLNAEAQAAVMGF